MEFLNHAYLLAIWVISDYFIAKTFPNALVDMHLNSWFILSNTSSPNKQPYPTYARTVDEGLIVFAISDNELPLIRGTDSWIIWNSPFFTT